MTRESTQIKSEPSSVTAQRLSLIHISFYTDAVAWAVENGVTNGTTDSTFSPDNGCTRAQIVTFLFRAYQGK